jgi:hypothetical protein
MGGVFSVLGVVRGVRVCREPGVVPGGWDGDFEDAAEVGDRAGEDPVCPVGRAGQAGFTPGACSAGLPGWPGRCRHELKPAVSVIRRLPSDRACEPPGRWSSDGLIM